MDVDKIVEFPSNVFETFLMISDLGRELVAGKTGEFSTFPVPNLTTGLL